MEQFVAVTVAGGLALVAGLWAVELFPAGVGGLLGIGLTVLGVGGLIAGMQSEIERPA